jgi:hypothetical protein
VPAAETARLIASLELESAKFNAGVNKAVAGLGKLESRAFRVGQHIGTGINTAAKNIASIGLIAGGVAVAGITKSVQAASNLEQAIGAVDSVYGKSAKTIEAWGDTAAEAAGLSRREVNEMAAVTGAQLQGMGFAAEEAAEQAVVLQKRAADLAATFGGPTSDAMQAISSLMRGERDPIERYGVSIKAVDVSARVAAKGLDTSTAAAKKNAEAIAGMELLMEQTAKTQGQFAREANGLAGSQARLRANLENTGAIIGRTLLPQLAKLTGKFNDLLVKNQPAIARFAEQLPAAFDQILSAVERIPWESIGASLQVAGIGAKALLDAFLGLPPWVQTAVITGWGLNKLTGGALGNIVGELGKGLIKGVLGMNAGVVNINAANVNGGTGLLGAGGKSSPFALLLSATVATAIIAAAIPIGEAFKSALPDWLKGPGGQGKSDSQLAAEHNRRVAEEERRRRSPLNLSGSPEDRQARSDLHKLAQVALEEHRRGERETSATQSELANIAGGVTEMRHALHADLQTAIGAIESSNDPAVIAAAIDAALASVRGGAGSAATTTGLIGNLKEQLKAAEAAGNKPLADKIKAAIGQLEPFAKGRQWQAEQIQKAREIVASTKSAEQKTAALKGIQQDLLSHQRSMAAGIVGGLLDVVTAIKNIKISTTGAVNNNQGGGAVPRDQRPGPRPAPKNISGSPDDRDLTINVVNSTSDQNTTRILRSRIGPTPAEAGSA